MRAQSHLRNSILWVISLAAAVALLVLLAAAPAWAQNPVPPTAREAAAGRREGTISPQDVGYENGPVNGTSDAWTINFGYVVSDSFVLNDVAGGAACGKYGYGTVWKVSP
jgi:hypothetical protein